MLKQVQHDSKSVINSHNKQKLCLVSNAVNPDYLILIISHINIIKLIKIKHIKLAKPF
jgi:formate-dependent phosphoribosylglycinamide formyltransferase (GAR transformylase)